MEAQEFMERRIAETYGCSEEVAKHMLNEDYKNAALQYLEDNEYSREVFLCLIAFTAFKQVNRVKRGSNDE